MLIWLIHLADKQQSVVTRAGTNLRHHNNRQRQLVLRHTQRLHMPSAISIITEG